jgi:DNA polymerase epsilon subunit 2
MVALGARALAVAVNDRFKLHGLSLMGDAMRALLAHLETTTASEHDAIDAVLKVLSATELSSSVVRKEMVESAIETLLSSALEEGGVDGSSDGATTAAEATTTTMMMDGGALASVPADGLTVCDAFKTKRYAYDGQRRMFDEVSKAGGIECEAGSKIDLYRDRFLLLQQRLNRSRMFSQPTLTTSARQGLTLSSIQSLLGDVKESKLIMGCLSQLEDGVFYVEDLTGTVRVDLTACEKDVGLFHGELHRHRGG